MQIRTVVVLIASCLISIPFSWFTFEFSLGYLAASFLDKVMPAHCCDHLAGLGRFIVTDFAVNSFLYTAVVFVLAMQYMVPAFDAVRRNRSKDAFWVER